MRNERARHARPGEEMQNYYAQRTKQCRLVNRPTCKAVTPVRIDFVANVVKIAGRPRIKKSADLDAFAQSDGFSDWKDLCALWAEEHDLPLFWSGVLIEWRTA